MESNKELFYLMKKEVLAGQMDIITCFRDRFESLSTKDTIALEIMTDTLADSLSRIDEMLEPKKSIFDSSAKDDLEKEFSEILEDCTKNRIKEALLFAGQYFLKQNQNLIN